MKNDKCKICRRLGAKLFLKGERCLSSKCSFIRKPYSPGQKGKRRTRGGSEYGKELKEKEKLKNWYNLRERQFEKYVNEVLERRGKVEDAAALLIQKLESRLDNVVFRMGFVSSRSRAKQSVGHGHFLVNNKKIDIPSYSVRKGDVIALSKRAQKKAAYQNLSAILKKYTPPFWIQIDSGKLEGKIIKDPSLEEITPPAEISSIFEFYSR